MNKGLTTFLLFLVTFVVEGFGLLLSLVHLGSIPTVGWIGISFFIGFGFVMQTPYRGPEDVREEVLNGGMTVPTALRHMMTVKSGTLLMLPGYVTDVFGLLLRVPPIRDKAIEIMIRQGRSQLDSAD